MISIPGEDYVDFYLNLRKTRIYEDEYELKSIIILLQIK